MSSLSASEKEKIYPAAVYYVRTGLERDAQAASFNNLFMDWEQVIDQWERPKANFMLSYWDVATNLSPSERAEWVLMKIYSSPLDFRAGQIFLAMLIERGDEIPHPLRLLIGAMLRGDAKPPDKRRKPYISRELLSVILAHQVKKVVKEFRLDPYHNGAGSVQRMEALSACQAVSDGWNEFRKNQPESKRRNIPTMSYSTVRDAYQFTQSLPTNF